ncbi:MAG: septation protein SpoVG family protein [Candidatus Chromulinivorax sp.]
MKDKVSEVQIIPLKPKDGLVAFASCIFNQALYISSIAIYTRPNGGFRLSFPTKKSATSSIPIFHPINTQTKNLIEEAILHKYQEIICDDI